MRQKTTEEDVPGQKPWLLRGHWRLQASSLRCSGPDHDLLLFLCGNCIGGKVVALFCTGTIELFLLSGNFPFTCMLAATGHGLRSSGGYITARPSLTVAG